VQLSELKKEMQFNGELLSLIGTLKNIAGSRHATLSREKQRFDAFMDAFKEFFRVVHFVETDNPLVHVSSDMLGIILVTSNSGFMGGLNANIMRTALEIQGDLPDDKVKMIVVGEKGAGALSDAKREYKFFSGIEDETRYEQSIEMTDYLMKECFERRIGRLVMVYPYPDSFSQQTVRTFNVLPCAALFDESEESDAPADEADPSAAPKKNLIARWADDARSTIVESSFEDMVEYLVRTWIVSKLYEVFEDSKLAEYGAQAMHLEGSHQKLQEGHKKLQSQYFRAVHEKIDKGMRESYSAGSIRKKKKKAAAKAARDKALEAQSSL
jgi:ATP synthase F1 gamma subunit